MAAVRTAACRRAELYAAEPGAEPLPGLGRRAHTLDDVEGPLEAGAVGAQHALLERDDVEVLGSSAHRASLASDRAAAPLCRWGIVGYGSAAAEE